jgi:pyruvate/2-oxoglutarate dehydrogenase complex dihydrolipoamide acyltransferase (E2) component
MIELRVPLGLLGTSESGSIILWLYKDGDFVKQGDVVAELLVEKTTIEIESPKNGILNIKMETEVPVSEGDLLAVII